MDAGARGRRLLQRREYRAKVSEFIPKELEDQFSYDKNGQLVFELDMKNLGDKIKRKAGEFFKKMTSGPIIKPYPTQQQYRNSVDQGTSNQYQSYEPEGEMIEANSAQMKAMHDAKMKKKEDDKVAEKKKDMKEGSKYGMYKGSGKPSGAFKDYLDKKKKEKEKEKVDEACWKGYEKKGMKTMFGKRYPNCVKKTKKEEVELEAKKSCGEGEYYCHDEQKCKPIPKGSKVDKGGMLVKEDDMKGMSVKSGHKRSVKSGAGMTAKGVAAYRRRNPGSKLKTAVTTPPSKLKPGSKAAKRRKSFCARSRSWTGPRGKAARRRWNCSYEPELPMIIDEKKKLFNTAPLSDRVSNWSKKINEGDVYVKSNRNRLTGLPNLGKGDKKTTEKKITGVDYKTMLQSYEPQGDMIERKMTSAEKDKKEKYVKGMKKVKGDFTKRYGKDGKSVMYATATKMAMKEESCGKGEYYCYDDKKCKPIPEGMKVGKDGMLVKEAKVDKGKSDYAKQNERNQRTFGNRRGSRGSLASHEDTEARRYNTKKSRGVKMKGKKDKTPVNYHKKDSQARVDALLKSMKEDFYKKKYDVKKGGYQKTNKMTKSNKRSGDSKAQYRQVHKDLAKENIFQGVKGDGYLGKTPIPNPIRLAKDVVDTVNRQQKNRIDKLNKISPNSGSINIPKPFNTSVSPASTRYLGLKNEGSLHKWFKGSKSKDGKPGWVNVVTGGTCASDKPGEGTPKCVSSSKRASMSKAERLSASRRKKKADPGQQSKSGAAKPTYVATDSKKKK